MFQDGSMKIREAIESDSGGMIELFYKLDSETKYMMMEPGERNFTVDDQAKQIKSFSEANNMIMVVALVKGVVSGFLVASSGTANRNRHSASMIIGVAKNHWGQGIGTSLIEYMEDWARSFSMHRIEFTVVETNAAARSLYRKCGYIEEGVKRDSLKVDGKYVNEIYMSKLFKVI